MPFVAVVQTADFGSHHDASGRLDDAFRRSILAERQVRPRPLVVRNVGPKDTTKMPLIEDDDVVQTLATDRPMTRSTWGFCQGERGAVRTAVRPKASTARPNAASKVVSRSNTRRAPEWVRPFRRILRATAVAHKDHKTVGVEHR